MAAVGFCVYSRWSEKKSGTPIKPIRDVSSNAVSGPSQLVRVDSKPPLPSKENPKDTVNIARLVAPVLAVDDPSKEKLNEGLKAADLIYVPKTVTDETDLYFHKATAAEALLAVNKFYEDAAKMNEGPADTAKSYKKPLQINYFWELFPYFNAGPVLVFDDEKYKPCRFVIRDLTKADVSVNLFNLFYICFPE